MSSKTKKHSSSTTASNSFNSVFSAVWKSYQNSSTVRTRIIDIFLLFLVALGIFQFAICLVIGTYPFNAFLAGFIATVGQFVLTAGLRLQINPDNHFSHTPERAFGDFIFSSLILHFLVYHFIN